MKILYVHSFYAPFVMGGAERTLQRLAEGMVERKHDVRIFTTADRSYDDILNGIIIYRRKIRNLYWHFRNDLPDKISRSIWHYLDRRSESMKGDLMAVLEDFAPDIVSFHNLPGLTASCWPESKDNSFRSVQVLHDLNLICPNSSMYRRGASCVNRCSMCAFYRRDFSERSAHIDACVGISSYMLHKAREYNMFPAAKFLVINNAQNIAPIAPPIFSGKLKFGYIGSLTPAKGIGWLIEHLPSDITLKVAGTGSTNYLNYLKRAAHDKDVSFLGQQKPSEFYAQVDVVVIPSLWNEALGGVAIEASAHHRPVLATRRGGLPEIIKHGVNGFLFEPNEPSSFRKAVIAISEKAEFDRMVIQSRLAVSHFLDIERFLDDYERLYHDLMERKT